MKEINKLHKKVINHKTAYDFALDELYLALMKHIIIDLDVESVYINDFASDGIALMIDFGDGSVPSGIPISTLFNLIKLSDKIQLSDIIILKSL